MRGAGIGYGGAVDQILEALPLDSTGHVMDCGYDDNGRCGCYDLPSKIGKIIAAAKAEVLEEAAADVPMFEFMLVMDVGAEVAPAQIAGWLRGRALRIRPAGEES